MIQTVKNLSTDNARHAHPDTTLTVSGNALKFQIYVNHTIPTMDYVLNVIQAIFYHPKTKASAS
jgi:hypothetical protein